MNLRRIGKRLFPGSVVLMYHRVAQAESDPWSLCVSPEHFAEHLEVLQKSNCTVPLSHLDGTLTRQRSPRRKVAITFDDGYADNFQCVRPLLERYGIPATFFLTSGFMGGEREFWWDELEKLLLQPSILPNSLSLEISGRSYRWELGSDAYYPPEVSERNSSWRALRESPPTARQRLYLELCEVLRAAAPAERQRTMDELLVWAGAVPACRPTYRPMTTKEAAALSESTLIEVGAHTEGHPYLAVLSPAEQEREIRENKMTIEQVTGRPVRRFAYPHGGYNVDTVAIVRALGFACACTTVSGAVRKGTDPLRMPRWAVEDWDGEAFARRLTACFGH